MNQNLILRIVGVILCIEALCMIPPLLLSVFGGGVDQRAFLYALLICGGGVVRARAHHEFEALANRIDSPVAITVMGAGGFRGRNARRLCQTTRQKHWLAHPKADLYLAEKIALFQRLYR